MKRTSKVLGSITTIAMAMAITAGPAVASSSYESLSAILGAPPVEKSKNRPAHDYTSINAILGANGQPDRVSSPVEKPGYRSPSSIVGPTEPVSEQTASVVRERSGFDWGDALIGAVGALGLALISLATVHVIRRRRHVTAESRA